MYIYDNIYLSSSYNENCFRKKFVEKIKTHFNFNNFFPENRGVSKMMCKIIVEPKTLHMAI